MNNNKKYTRLPYGKNSPGYDEFIIDETVDLECVPTSGSPGSKLFCIENSATYMLTNKHQWQRLQGGSSNISVLDDNNVVGVGVVGTMTVG